MGAYLLTYTASAPIKRPVPLDIRPNKVVIGTLFGLFLLALYQTVKYRTDIGGIPDVEIEHGKFVGSINGWQYTLNRFALFPITYFLMYRRTRVLGIAALIVLTAVRMYDYGDRLTMMSPFAGRDVPVLVSAKAKVAAGVDGLHCCHIHILSGL